MRAIALNCSLKRSREPSKREIVAAIGFAVPGQSWTYWSKGPGPGPSYLEADDGRDWTRSTGEAAVANLRAVARTLARTPMPPAGTATQ